MLRATVEWAAGMRMPSGRYCGRPLGALGIERPDYVAYVARLWPDPQLRAAARVVLAALDVGDLDDPAADLAAIAIAVARQNRTATEEPSE